MDFLVEELTRIINELIEIPNNSQSGIDLQKMRDICNTCRFALERYRLVKELTKPSYPVNPIARNLEDGEDEVGKPTCCECHS